MIGKKISRALAMALALAGSTMLTSLAEARTNHALLVAVTKYPNLPQKTWLIGPKNDAAMVRDYLLNAAPVKFETANVTVLADEVEGANASPTRANILAALKELAGKVQPDDFVYMHLSGHGAQEPQAAGGDETDGLNEIFLPADTSKWVDRDKGVPNALVDDDIGAALDAIRGKGAFVWIIFDACHSGTATRAAPVDEDLEVSRKVEAGDLGIPDEAIGEAAAEAAKASGGTDADASRQPAFSLIPEGGEEDASRAVDLTAEPTGAEAIKKGGMVAFYAAQTVETTPEMPLPKGEKDAQRYGLFTYTLFSKLAENPGLTYRQLGRAVLQQYAAGSRERPTPLFEGELDARVFGTDAAVTAQEWPVSVKDGQATLSAGKLHGLAAGAKLALLPSPGAPVEQALGYVEVKSLTNLTSRVAPVAFADKPAPDMATLGAITYAQLAEVSVDFQLKVARPAETDDLKDAVSQANAALDALMAEPEKRFNIELVPAGAEADLRLAVLRESELPGAPDGATDAPALFFLPPSGDLTFDKGQRPPLVAINSEDPDKLLNATRDNLEKVFRATSLSRIAAASAQELRSVNVGFNIKRVDSGAIEPLDGSSVPVVNPGDEVHIVAENTSNKIFDINVLYVGSDYSISHMGAQRLVANAKLEEGLLAFTDSSFGMERMIAVVTEAPPLSEIEDLSFLQQGGVPPATRATSAPGAFSSLLTELGAEPSTRAAMKLGDKSGAQEGKVMVFSLQTEPKE